MEIRNKKMLTEVIQLVKTARDLSNDAIELDDEELGKKYDIYFKLDEILDIIQEMRRKKGVK